MYAKINRGLSSLSSLGLLVLRVGIGGIYFLLARPAQDGGGAAAVDKLGSSVTLVGIHFARSFGASWPRHRNVSAGCCWCSGFSRVRRRSSFLHHDRGWLHLHGTGRALETTTEPLEMAFVFLGLIFVGPGKYSVDAKLGAE